MDEIKNSTLMRITDYLAKNRGLFPRDHLCLLDRLKEMEIIKFYIERGELDKFITAELSEAHILGYQIYLKISNGNRLKRWLIEQMLTDFQKDCLETLRNDCEALEEEIKTPSSAQQKNSKKTVMFAVS